MNTPTTETPLDQEQPAIESTEAAETKTHKGAQRQRKPAYFPRPSKFKLKPSAFFKYCRDLSEECRGRTMMYLYGRWPVLNPMQGLTPEEIEKVNRKEMREPTTNIDKPDITELQTEDWEETFLHRYGSGVYHLKLNDCGVTGENKIPAKTICTCDISLNHPDYPPVRDWKLLDMGHPDNKSIIVQLRNRGVKLPGDELEAFERKEEEDMAQAEVTNKLVDALVTATKDKPAAAQQPSAQAIAESKSSEIIAAASAKSIEMMSDTFRQAQQVQAKAADPLEHIKALKEVANVLAPKGSDGNMELMLQMMKNQHESDMKMVEQLGKRLEAAETRNASLIEKMLTRPEPTERPRGLVAELKALSEAKDTIKDLMGLNGEEDDTPWWGRTIERVVDQLPQFGQGIAAFLQNAQAARLAQMNGGAPALPAPNEPTPVNQPAPAPVRHPAYATLEQLRPHIIECLRNNTPGYEFAAALIDQTKSEQLYNQLSSAGKQGLFDLLQHHPELWQQTREFGQRFDTFLDEFLDKAKVAECLQLTRAAQPPQGRVILDPTSGKPVQHRAPVVNSAPAPPAA